MKSCSFTGHRDIPKEDYSRVVDLLSRAVEYLYSEGVRNFYIGGALGFDTLAAKEIIKMKMRKSDVRLCLVLPCISQDAAWSARSRDMYEYILSVADEVEYVSEKYSKDCMRKRNARLVELCDVLVAYAFRERSGASQTVRMAQKKDKTVYNLYGK